MGYRVTRQTGSHLRLTTLERGEHHVTVPRHAAWSTPRVRPSGAASHPDLFEQPASFSATC
ncbi:MAG: type II toxin-antitoxin system HicA family toxin [candidate division NC10 bacterium]